MNSAFWFNQNLLNQYGHEGGTLTMKNVLAIIVILVIAIALFFDQIFTDHIISLNGPVGEWMTSGQDGVLVINNDKTGFRNFGCQNAEPFTWEYIDGSKIEIVPHKTVRMMTVYADVDTRTGFLHIYETPDFNPKNMIWVYSRKPTTKNALLP